MRPQDIEKIANSVMRALGRPTQASAGCQGISDPQAFDCPAQQEMYECGPTAAYECGGAGQFVCMAGQLFTCAAQFSCESMYSTGPT
ncbi:MAG: hypothetical protein JXR37_16965 [Kiritimatiellae bacterium]|nr:hypothetical protein [Kiritimatiellia bacterium]